MAPQKIVTDPPSIDTLQELIIALRSENGCPWDRKQTPESLCIYLIEEVYELVEAMAADDTDAIREELGDVLFQIFFVAYLYRQEGRFTLEVVLAQILNKMIRRHPHVFGSDKVENAGEVKQRWREIKQQEKGRSSDSLLDSVPTGMPALMRSYRISERAAGTGFDWDTLEGVIAQAETEWSEFKAEVKKAKSSTRADKTDISMEFGDVLFTLANVARLAGIHPETALSQSTQKFIRRFKLMEAMAVEQNSTLEQIQRDEMERLWQAAKIKLQTEG